VGECPVDDAISVVKDREGLAGKDQSIGGTRVAGVAGADGVLSIFIFAIIPKLCYGTTSSTTYARQ